MSREAGDPRPRLRPARRGRARVSLSALAGKIVVLYFYPKDDTSGCTAEAKAFSEAAGDSPPPARWWSAFRRIP